MAKKNSQSLKLLAIIVIAVVAFVAGVYAFLTWQSSQPPTNPKDIAITASVGDDSLEVTPYMVCEPGVECPEGDVPTLKVSADDTVTIEIPEEIYDHDWQLLTIYDDPGANDQQVHGPRDVNKVEVPVSAAPVGDSPEKPQLVVVEVSSVMIGLDDHDEETPYLTTWSVAFEQA
ncbi:DUF2771 domain-containing protein [Corynebacterium breve]|uniref:DUF2771 domain-containing protein n=1 Tax=Corynebacterium breve TaxID=3049799 RepID=A0ABY8VFC9_9CORY|nr:DUF2771 domain-containing protein [Corynebacterium breve]WIM68351.1 DUF2771 domain-containing protein [Corynebacterium breve]